MPTKFVSKIQWFLILFNFLDTGNLVEAFDGFNLSFSREEATSFHNEIVGKILLPYWQQFELAKNLEEGEIVKDPCVMLHSIENFSEIMGKFAAMEMFETLYGKIPINLNVNAEIAECEKDLYSLLLIMEIHKTFSHLNFHSGNLPENFFKDVNEQIDNWFYENLKIESHVNFVQNYIVGRVHVHITDNDNGNEVMTHHNDNELVVHANEEVVHHNDVVLALPHVISQKKRTSRKRKHEAGTSHDIPRNDNTEMMVTRSRSREKMPMSEEKNSTELAPKKKIMKKWKRQKVASGSASTSTKDMVQINVKENKWTELDKYLENVSIGRAEATQILKDFRVFFVALLLATDEQREINIYTALQEEKVLNDDENEEINLLERFGKMKMAKTGRHTLDSFIMKIKEFLKKQHASDSEFSLMLFRAILELYKLLDGMSVKLLKVNTTFHTKIEAIIGEIKKEFTIKKPRKGSEKTVKSEEMQLFYANFDEHIQKLVVNVVEDGAAVSSDNAMDTS